MGKLHHDMHGASSLLRWMAMAPKYNMMLMTLAIIIREPPFPIFFFFSSVKKGNGCGCPFVHQLYLGTSVPGGRVMRRKREMLQTVLIDGIGKWRWNYFDYYYSVSRRRTSDYREILGMIECTSKDLRSFGLDLKAMSCSLWD